MNEIKHLVNTLRVMIFYPESGLRSHASISRQKPPCLRTEKRAARAKKGKA